jgi:hypothetical protein
LAQNGAAENPAPLTWQIRHQSRYQQIRLLIRLLKGAVHSGARARLRFLKQLHRFMADCSITAGIHLIVAQGFVTKNNASPSRPYALT